MKEKEPLLKEEKDILFVNEEITEKVSETEEIYRNEISLEKTEYNNFEEEKIIDNSEVIETEKIESSSEVINKEEPENNLVTIKNDKKFNIKKTFEKYTKKELIITAILTFVVLYFFGRVCYGYYLGFKYWDYIPEETNNSANTETKHEDKKQDNKKEDKNIYSDAIEESYYKFKSDICLNNKELIDKFYVNRKVEKTELRSNEIGIIVFDNISEISEFRDRELIIELETISSLVDELFADPSYLKKLTSITETDFGVYHVKYDDAANVFKVSANDFDICDDIEYTESFVENVEEDGNHVYIYERFGYVKNNENGTYNVYSDGLGENLLLTYNRDNEELSPENLQLYKWTLKKGKNNTYYFVSIEPSNK